MKPLHSFAMVKECKGAALSILVLLETNQRLGGGAVTQEWLEWHSGYTDKPVSKALAYLSETDHIQHPPVGWRLWILSPHQTHRQLHPRQQTLRPAKNSRTWRHPARRFSSRRISPLPPCPPKKNLLGNLPTRLLLLLP